jgi:hypothetical protein
MSTYEKFDTDEPYSVHKKIWKKELPFLKTALSEILVQLSKSPMDKETYGNRANFPEKEYGRIEWILTSLGDKKEVKIQGQQYVGLSAELRNDIKKYGAEKVTDTLLEEFGEMPRGHAAAIRWKKKYRNE